MRVGVYFPFFAPSAGGGHTFEQELLDALLRLAPNAGHQFTLFFKDKTSADLPETQNIKSIWVDTQPPLPPPPLPAPKRILQKILIALGLKAPQPPVAAPEPPFQRELKKHHLDLFWFPTPSHFQVDIPYLATVWDIQHRVQPWFPEVSSNGQWEHRELNHSTYLRRASTILACNEAARRELSFFYQIPEGRFRLLPHPTPVITEIPSEEDVHVVLEKYSLRKPYLFYPAQFWAHKNHVNLLLALKLLREQHGMEIHLVLAGSDQGNQGYVNAKIKELGLNDCVHLLGFVSRRDLLALYRGAFALSYMTYFGPENLPPLEAFSLGCPVVASRVDGASEQLGDAAILVDANSPQEISLAVRNLYHDPALRNDLIDKGRERAKRFTSLDYVKAVFSIIDDFEAIRRNWESA